MATTAFLSFALGLSVIAMFRWAATRRRDGPSRIETGPAAPTPASGGVRPVAVRVARQPVVAKPRLATTAGDLAIAREDADRRLAAEVDRKHLAVQRALKMARVAAERRATALVQSPPATVMAEPAPEPAPPAASVVAVAAALREAESALA